MANTSMANKFSTLLAGIALVAVANTASAEPITGNLEFFSGGNFLSSDGTNATDGSGNGILDMCADGVTLISDSLGGACANEGGIESGPATGFDFTGLPPFLGANQGLVGASTGALDTFYNVNGSVADLVDIDLNNLPQNEFTIDLSSTLGGVLKFVIETGTEIDTGLAGKWDIGGTGYFDFTCDGSVSSCEDEQTNGNWSVSNTGGSFVIGFNAVPAPSVLALFGLGLLGLGTLRARRKA